jgi:hypothetical protein
MRINPAARVIVSDVTTESMLATITDYLNGRLTHEGFSIRYLNEFAEAPLGWPEPIWDAFNEMFYAALAYVDDPELRDSRRTSTRSSSPPPSARGRRALPATARGMPARAGGPARTRSTSSSPRTPVLPPDLLVARRTDTTERNLPMAPVLAIEVLSPSTRLIDLNLKRARYEAAGCSAYWVVDPELPALTAWEQRDGV